MRIIAARQNNKNPEKTKIINIFLFLWQFLEIFTKIAHLRHRIVRKPEFSNNFIRNWLKIAKISTFLSILAAQNIQKTLKSCYFHYIWYNILLYCIVLLYKLLLKTNCTKFVFLLLICLKLYCIKSKSNNCILYD